MFGVFVDLVRQGRLAPSGLLFVPELAREDGSKNKSNDAQYAECRDGRNAESGEEQVGEC